MDILARLPNLPADQLRAIVDSASILLALDGKGKKAVKRDAPEAGPETDFCRDLYEALAGEIERRHRTKQRPWAVFACSADYEKYFRPAAEAAYAANCSWFPRQSKQERLSMARLYASLCVSSLEARGAPLVWGLLNSTIATLPAVVDRAFPGYAAAGLLGKVQSLRTKGR